MQGPHRVAILLCLVAAGAGVAFVRCTSDPAPRAPEDGCLSAGDRQLARTLADLPFLTNHPEPAETADEGSGCSPDGQISAGRTYYWKRLDPGQVTTFYQTVAARDGWKPRDREMCFTKEMSGRAAFLQLEFDDSSEFGPEGDVYSVAAWLPGPNEAPGC